MVSCAECGKEVKKPVKKGGNSFCSGKCLSAFEKRAGSQAEDVCEFC